MDMKTGSERAAEEPPRQPGIIGMFNRAASTYDRIGPRVFSHFGQRLVDLAHLAPGAHVLDVATGRGAVLFPATTQVGPHGQVIGIDLSEAMVQETAVELQRAAWPQAEIRQMDAAQLDFPDASFDAVLCGFALWFFPQPARALQEWFRVLKPGGRMGLTTWAEHCPFVNWQREVLRPYVHPPGPQAHAAREAPRFDTPATVEAALQQAGFERMQILVEEGEFVLANDEEVWARLWSSGPRRQLEHMTGPVLDQVKRDVLQKVQVFKQPDGIHLLWRALCALGDKPHR
jgi:ubiquinone/menaquinone biosynthesis C-methylase UbiE